MIDQDTKGFSTTPCEKASEEIDFFEILNSFKRSPVSVLSSYAIPSCPTMQRSFPLFANESPQIPLYDDG